jgi:CO/xanthine dehydrogenase Mo-binding subunit
MEIGGFSDYPLFTAADAPEIETIILESPETKPSGCREPPIGPIAPAIANAIFSLTGVRLCRLPMTPARVKNALS